MTAQILPFRPRPKAKREAEQAVEAIFEYWRAFFRAYGFDVYARVEPGHDEKEPA